MQMEWGYVGAVVISGLVIVFVALILLILAVTLMGKIFDLIKSKKNSTGTPQIKESVPVKPVNECVCEEEDDEEIIAVIAAAVAAMSDECGVPLKLKSVKRRRANAWANAAVNENTRVF